MFDTVERMYDPTCSLHVEGDADLVPMIVDTSMYELVYVTVFGLGIAGSMGTTNAIKFTINDMTSDKFYDLRHPNEIASGVWAIWLTFALCLAVTTLVTGYFARMIGLVKMSRRKLFAHWSDKRQQEQRRQQLEVEYKDFEHKEERIEEELQQV